MIFDSHAHYDDEQFDCDREELLGSMQEHGIGGIINVGALWRVSLQVRSWRINTRLFMQGSEFIRIMWQSE